MTDDFAGVTHSPGPDGLFGTTAPCGADPDTNPGRLLRLQDAGFTCLVCAEMVAEPSEPAAEPCKGIAYSTNGEAFDAAVGAGFTSWHMFTCTEGHTHVSDGEFGA